MPATPHPFPTHSAVVADLRDRWNILTTARRVAAFTKLDREEAEDLFFDLSSTDQAKLLVSLPAGERRSWMRLLAPDDAADLVQEAPEVERDGLLGLLDDPTRKEVNGLLAYAEDAAGGLMNPRYARVRPEMSVDEAIAYIRKQARENLERIHNVYAVDAEQKLQGEISFRRLFASDPAQTVREVMRTELVTVREHTDQEEVSRLFARHALVELPVVDAEGRIQGVVTVDDIVDVVREADTEDIQKMGGSEALDAPYLEIGFLHMVKKRAGWLTILFLGEMLTATAMGKFEGEIAKAVVLALFVPLIISSGGNSGSQATTLVIRALALGEVKLRDWWRVLVRELGSGLMLGTVLGLIGLIRILVWQRAFHTYGEHYVKIAFTVSLSLLGIVLWGTISGSMLPFILRRAGFDPASASAPFVATLVDVTGLIIYFTVASVILKGTLL